MTIKKHLKPSLLLVFLVTLLAFFISCSGNTDIDIADNKINKNCIGNLKDKPLDHIKSCIYGKWKLVYTSGGISGNAF